MSFKVGQEIVCVKKIPSVNIFGRPCDVEKYPLLNTTYVIQGFKTRADQSIGCFLKGFYQTGASGRINFNVNCFRPLNEVLSEISIAELTEVLKPELV